MDIAGTQRAALVAFHDGLDHTLPAIGRKVSRIYFRADAAFAMTRGLRVSGG
jgi:hypothetical protein